MGDLNGKYSTRQLLLSGANDVMKSQNEDDRMKSGRIMTFNR